MSEAGVGARPLYPEYRVSPSPRVVPPTRRYETHPLHCRLMSSYLTPPSPPPSPSPEHAVYFAAAYRRPMYNATKSDVELPAGAGVR